MATAAYFYAWAPGTRTSLSLVEGPTEIVGAYGSRALPR